MEKLTWKKDIFGSKLEIRQGTEQVGRIDWKHMLSAKAQAMFNGRLFVLNREHFLSKMEIFDGNSQTLLGSIVVNLFNPCSDVLINGKRFELEIKNFYQSRWAWKYNGEEIVTFTSHEFLTKEKGTIELNTTCSEETEILILLGLFVRNQFILYILLFVLILIVFIVR